MGLPAQQSSSARILQKLTAVRDRLEARKYSELFSILDLFSLSSPEMLLIGSFAGIIFAGTLFLWLPWSHLPGQVSFLDALFTATSAVCVTGLTVVDTGKDYTLLGQWGIVGLIQVGGLGVMTFASVAFAIMGKRLGLRSQAAIQDTFYQREAATEFKRAFKRILLLTVALETTGMIVLFLALPEAMPLGTALYSAFFHSISAFCNAGFSIYSDSLMALRENFLFTGAVMALIIAGGLGHTVVHEIWSHVERFIRGRKWEKPTYFSFHARVVLVTSLVLLAGGAVAIFLFGMTPGEDTFGLRVWNALFQSVTARTAGFNTVDIGALNYATLLVVIMLMFIGGSPASCAGGIKTTSAAIWVARVRARLLGEDNVTLFDRRITDEQVRKTGLLIAVAVLWNVVGWLLLSATEGSRPGVDFEDLLFEQISAFATVGLSTGLTPTLTPLGKVWIILSMFVGRLGPLTIAFWAVQKRPSRVKYPDGTLMIG